MNDPRRTTHNAALRQGGMMELTITEQMEVAKRAEETLASIYRRNEFSNKPPRISQGTVKVIVEIARDVVESRAPEATP